MNFNTNSDLEGAAPRCRLCSWLCIRIRGDWSCDRCELPSQHRPLGIEDASLDRNATSTNTMSRDESSSVQEMEVQVSTGFHSVNAGDEDGIPSWHHLNGDVASQVSQTKASEGSVPLVSHIVASQGSRDSAAPGPEEAGSEESWEEMDLDDNDEDTTHGATQLWVIDQPAVGTGQRSNDVQYALALADIFDLIPRPVLNIPSADLELEISDDMDIEE